MIWLGILLGICIGILIQTDQKPLRRYKEHDFVFDFCNGKPYKKQL